MNNNFQPTHVSGTTYTVPATALTFSDQRTLLTGVDGLLVNIPGGAFIDNVLRLQNTSGGFSSVTGFRPADGGITVNGAASWALGYGAGSTRGGGGNTYADRVYLGLAPKGSSTSDDPPDFVIGGESDKSGGTYRSRELLLWNGVDKTWTWRGWSDGAVQGPLASFIAADGRMGIGTATLTAGAQITVGGTGQIQLLGGTPYITGDGQLRLYGDGYAHIDIRPGGQPYNTYSCFGGTVASNAGHQFITGVSPTVRMVVADDGVKITNLPSSDPGVSGALWNSSGTVHISL